MYAIEEEVNSMLVDIIVFCVMALAMFILVHINED